MKWYDLALFVAVFLAAKTASEYLSDEPHFEYVTSMPPTWNEYRPWPSLVGDWASSDGRIRFSFDGRRYAMYAPDVAVRGDYRQRSDELILQVDGDPPDVRWTGTVRWENGVLVLRSNGTGLEQRFVRCHASA